MGLQFILGRANTDKRGVMLDEIAEIMEKDKDAALFYLVPDHIKFQTEMTVLEELGKRSPFNKNEVLGMMQLQVFSFSRLAWYWLQDTDIFVKPQLTTAGLSMLIRKLLLQHEEELTIYRGEVRKEGFIQQTTDLFSELRNGRITAEDLDELLQAAGNDPKEEDFKLKLNDLSIIYQRFNHALKDKYIESEDILSALKNKIEELDLSKTIIYVERYDRFTAQEQQLLIALMTAAKNVTIALTLDQAYPAEKPEMLDLFQAAGETYHNLYQAARQNQIPVYRDRVIRQLDPAYCKELNLLETFWVDSSKLSPIDSNQSSQDFSAEECLEVWAAENKQAEVMHTANKIRKLVSSGKYRYQDILVLTRNMNDYLTLLEPVFSENDIETFIDKADLMAHHPFVEFLDALLSIKRKNWRYPDIMRLLRTELLVPADEEIKVPAERSERIAMLQKRAAEFRDRVDITENVILAYGYEGYQWTMKEPWHYTRYFYEDEEFQSDHDQQIEQTANAIKSFLQTTLLPFFDQLEKAETSAEAVKLLFLFLEKYGVDKQLVFWRDQAIENNDLEMARKQEQTWQTFLQLLDEYVELLGDDPFNSEDFQAILSTGFENASYSMVPPNIDQVIFSGLESTRAGTAKVTFILGVTDNHLPAKAENKSVLTEEDRERFAQFLPADKFLKPSIESVMASEPFIAYQAFLNASEKLYFSYPASDDSKEAPKLSPYVERIVDRFSIRIQKKNAAIVSLTDPSNKEISDFIGSKQPAMSQLLMVLREEQERRAALKPFWFELYRYFKRDPETSLFFSRLLSSLVKKNIPKPVKPELAEELYGKDLHLSVSRLETFYSDHYAHFLTYGLKLKERDLFGLSPAGTGEFFHDALDQLFKLLIAENVSIAHLSEKDLLMWTDAALNRLYQQPKFAVLSASNRMNYIKEQLAKTIQRVAWALSHQSRRSKSKTVQTEVLFGLHSDGKSIEGLTYPLMDGRQLYVRGKIDRVDALELNGEHYLSIVDYKSSEHAFNYRDAYYGLALQMITYLDTAIANSKQLIGHQAKPAGAFYMHVKNPFIKSDKLLINEEHYTETMLNLFKLDGLLLEDDDLLRSLDLALEPSSSSLIYPFRQLKSERLTSPKFVTIEEINALRAHTNKLIIEAGNKILNGVTTLNPFYEKRQFIPTVNGPLRAVSQFDAMLPENNYRRMDQMTREQILEKMQNPDQEEEES